MYIQICNDKFTFSLKAQVLRNQQINGESTIKFKKKLLLVNFQV